MAFFEPGTSSRSWRLSGDHVAAVPGVVMMTEKMSSDHLKKVVSVDYVLSIVAGKNFVSDGLTLSPL